MSLPSVSPENNIGTLDRYFERIDFASATENLEALIADIIPSPFSVTPILNAVTTAGSPDPTRG